MKVWKDIAVLDRAVSSVVLIDGVHTVTQGFDECTLMRKKAQSKSTNMKRNCAGRDGYEDSTDN